MPAGSGAPKQALFRYSRPSKVGGRRWGRRGNYRKTWNLISLGVHTLLKSDVVAPLHGRSVSIRGIDTHGSTAQKTETRSGDRSCSDVSGKSADRGSCRSAECRPADNAGGHASIGLGLRGDPGLRLSVAAAHILFRGEEFERFCRARHHGDARANGHLHAPAQHEQCSERQDNSHGITTSLFAHSPMMEERPPARQVLLASRWGISAHTDSSRLDGRSSTTWQKAVAPASEPSVHFAPRHDALCRPGNRTNTDSRSDRDTGTRKGKPQPEEPSKSRSIPNRDGSIRHGAIRLHARRCRASHRNGLHHASRRVHRRLHANYRRRGRPPRRRAELLRPAARRPTVVPKITLRVRFFS